MSDNIPSMDAAPAPTLTPEAAPEAVVAETAPVTESHWLPEELRAEVGLNKFKDVAGLAKSYLEAEKKISGAVKLPTEKSTPEEINGFYAKLGRPESADKYEFTLEHTDETRESPEIKALLDTAFESGLSQKQVGAIMKYYDNMMATYTENSVKQAEETKATLQKEWGKEFDNNMAAANVALKTYHSKFPAEMTKLSRDPAFANNAVILSLFAELGSRMQEGRAVHNPNTPSFSADKSQAMSALEALRKDPSHPYWVAGHPQHLKAVQEVNALYEAAYK